MVTKSHQTLVWSHTERRPGRVARLNYLGTKDGNKNTESQDSAGLFTVKAGVISLTSCYGTLTTLFPDNALGVGAGGQCDDGRMSSGPRGDKSCMHLDATS